MFRQLFAEVEFDTAWEAVESFHVRGPGGVGVAGSTPEEDDAARYQYGECMDLVRGLARSISAGDPVKDTTLQTQLDRLRALRERKPGTTVDSKGAVSNIGDAAIVSGSAQPVAKQVSLAAAASTSVGGPPRSNAASTSVGGPPQPTAASSASAAGLNPSAAPIDRNFGNSAAAQRGGKQRGGGPAAPTFQGKAPPAYPVPARGPPAAAAANTHTAKMVGSTTKAPYRAGGTSNQQQHQHHHQGAPATTSTLPLKPPPQQAPPPASSGGFPAGTVLLPLGSDATRPASTPTAAHEDPMGMGGRQASSPAPAMTSAFSAADWTFDVTSGGDGGSTTTGSVWGGATF